MKKPLSHYFRTHRRYARSINLERDKERIEALNGYILTERSADALRRILAGLTDSGGNHAWTLTSVYGTGKSAFAHFFSCLAAPASSDLRMKSLVIAEAALAAEKIHEKLPKKGFFRAVATAQREPIKDTIIRALVTGAENYWTAKRKPNVAKKLLEISTNPGSVESKEIPPLIQEVAKGAKTGVLLIIDELGKSLEYAATSGGSEDLYLLQQLIELPKNGKQNPIYLLGILHQEFSEYGQNLAALQRNEWAKIQGRFEDIPFTDSTGQMIRLIAQVIDQSNAESMSELGFSYQEKIDQWSSQWLNVLGEITNDLTKENLASVYPLHPISALILPVICLRYAQQTRSLFTFLTSAEPFSFHNFLAATNFDGQNLPTLKLDGLYDYFIETVGMGMGSRPNMSRWVEIQGLIADASQLNQDSLRVLKVIGILNLLMSTSRIKASRNLVKLALCDSPESVEHERWEQAIATLEEKGIITHLKTLDELRIWQGSDFNVDAEVEAYIEKEREPISVLLEKIYPLNPLVAQRHSYITGTIRYFERCYLDNSHALTKLRSKDINCNGLIAYWLDSELPQKIPNTTADGKPLILVSAYRLESLRIRTLEFAALTKIQATVPQLQTDGVARKEVRYRLNQSKSLLDEDLKHSFGFVAQQQCWLNSEVRVITQIAEFQMLLSQVCDQTYPQSPKIWNELINRRELTSQGAMASRRLIEAMLSKGDTERLGLKGYGPEVCIYYSLLHETGIHRQEEGKWGFYPPAPVCSVWTVWQAIADFCQSSKQIQSLDKLYQILAQPPYGVTTGPIPILLTSVLLYHVDDVGVYKDGTFIPVLGGEHFELLVKDPSRFGVKYFDVAGLRGEVFHELEEVLRFSHAQIPAGMRNATMLMVVKPLYQFIKKLPPYTLQTKNLSEKGLAVREALQKAIEPDELLFHALPVACGLSPIGTEEAGINLAKTFRFELTLALKEIFTAYDRLLKQCENLLSEAFGIRGTNLSLREDLRLRSSILMGQCVERTLKSFTQAAVDEDKTLQEWLSALIMIVADKPAEAWTDENVTKFQIQLSEIARKFNNLETLQQNNSPANSGKETRMITITYPDGKETHQMIWIDNAQYTQAQQLGEEILRNLPDDKARLALIAFLTEKILSSNLD